MSKQAAALGSLWPHCVDLRRHQTRATAGSVPSPPFLGASSESRWPHRSLPDPLLLVAGQPMLGYQLSVLEKHGLDGTFAVGCVHLCACVHVRLVAAASLPLVPL